MASNAENRILLDGTYSAGDNNSSDQGGVYHRGAMFMLDQTDDVTTTHGLVATLQVRGYPDGPYFDYATLFTKDQTDAATAALFSVAPGSADVGGDLFMPRLWRVEVAVTVADADEVQTLELGDIGASDTFKIQTGGSGTKTGTITYSTVGTGTAMATAMQAALRLITGYGAVTVVKVSQTEFTVTFPKTMGDVVLLKVTDTATFDPKVDAGYTLGFIEATAGVAEPVFTLSASMLN